MGVLLGIASAVAPTDMDYLTYFTYNVPWVIFPFLMGFIITKICKPEKTIDGKAYFIQRSKSGTAISEISCGIPIYVATEPMLKQPATKTTIGKFTVIKSSLVAT